MSNEAEKLVLEVANENESSDSEATNVTQITAAPKVIRIVTMEDGSQANFGARANLLTKFDVAEATITFKISTGKIINWVINNIDNLTDFQKVVYFYGLQERVKSSLAAVKVDDLETAISKQVAAIESGVFAIRSTEQEGEAVLTDIQRAYAMVKAAADPSKDHWSDLTKPEVIGEVLTVWENFSAAEKNKMRRHPRVKFQLSLLELEAKQATDEVEELL